MARIHSLGPLDDPLREMGVRRFISSLYGFLLEFQKGYGCIFPAWKIGDAYDVRYRRIRRLAGHTTTDTAPFGVFVKTNIRTAGDTSDYVNALIFVGYTKERARKASQELGLETYVCYRYGCWEEYDTETNDELQSIRAFPVIGYGEFAASHEQCVSYAENLRQIIKHMGESVGDAHRTGRLLRKSRKVIRALDEAVQSRERSCLLRHSSVELVKKRAGGMEKADALLKAWRLY